MQQLLRITTVPISIEVSVKRAELVYDNQAPKVNVTRQRGGFKMEADPIKIKIDQQEVRNTMGNKSSDRLTRDYGEESFKVGYEATVRFVEEGNQLMDTKNITPADIAKQRTQRSIEVITSYMPQASPDISWQGGTLSINYTADKLDFDWITANRASFEFVPGSIEFVVKEYPRVEIEYLGEPIYVPPSANPNYIESEMDVIV